MISYFRKVSTIKYIHNQCIGTNPPQIHKRITKPACDNVELYMKTPPLRIPFGNWLIFYHFTVLLESITCIIKSWAVLFLQEPKWKGCCIKL